MSESKLYTAIDVQTQQRSTLKYEAKEALLDADPDLVRALPGHYEPPADEDGFVRYRQTKFDPLLDKLVDRKAFQAFIFVRRSQAQRAA